MNVAQTVVQILIGAIIIAAAVYCEIARRRARAAARARADEAARGREAFVTSVPLNVSRLQVGDEWVWPGITAYERRRVLAIGPAVGVSGGIDVTFELNDVVRTVAVRRDVVLYVNPIRRSSR